METEIALSAGELAAYSGLFLNAFLAATILPLPSEALLIGLLASGTGDPLMLFAAATSGNTLGSAVNWGIGRGIARLRHRSWFPVSEERYQAAERYFARYGLWSLLFAWLPIIGDALTMAAGALRVSLASFLVLVAIGKAARYAMVIAGVGWWTA